MKLHATLTDHPSLTPREQAVLRLLCEGLMRKQIARILHRSYGSVSKHIEAIAEKLDAHSTAEIIAKAVAKHWISITLETLLLFITL